MKLELCIFVTFTVTLVTAGKVLKEKPAFLTPCKLSDPNFGSCACKNVVGMLTEWKSGVPGLTNVVFDPLKVKRLSVSTGDLGPISLNAHFHDAEINWINGMTCKEASFDTKKSVLKVKLHTNKLKVKGNYELKGKLLNLALDAKGTGYSTYETAIANLAIKLKFREEDGNIFTDIPKVRANVEKVTDGHLHLDNLFNGDKASEDSANAILNESWEALFEIGRPAVNEAMEVILKDRMSKVFAYVPATYFFDDLPTV